MYITKAELARVEARYGRPAVLVVRQEIGPVEMEMLRASRRGSRSHDVTLFIRNARGQIALIRKPSFPPGVYRVPSGGVRPGEAFEDGARREAWEETGLDVRLERYLLRVEAVFCRAGEEEPWTSYVFSAIAAGGEPHPRDTEEIAHARWGTVEELQGPVRQAMLATGRGLFRYRVRLHDAAIEQLRGEAVGAGESALGGDRGDSGP